MTTTFHDAELLSAYLDGKLSPAEISRIESRLKTDPELRLVIEDLRQARAILRQLPQRRAPRNFTLTPKMAGIKPPLPRIFPIFQFASAISAILLIFTFAFNLSAPIAATMQAAAPMYTAGKGGGSDIGPAAAPSDLMGAGAAAPTLESQRNIAAPTAAAESAPATTEMSITADALPTELPAPQPAPQIIHLPVSPQVQYLLLGLAALLGAAAFLVRAQTERNWFKSHAVQPTGLDKNQMLLLLAGIMLALGLAAGVYWLANTTFYAPAPLQPLTFPGGDKGGPAASGDKNTSNAGIFTLSPDMGYNYSYADNAGYIIAIDFPAGTFETATEVAFYAPPPDQPASISLPDGYLFAGRIFQVTPLPQLLPVLTPYTITIYYSDADVASIADESSLLLLVDGQDAAGTCPTVSIYERFPEPNMLRVNVCATGSFTLAAPAK